MGRQARSGVTVAAARKFLLALPNVAEGRSYGMPSFLVNGRFLARFRDDDTVLALRLATIGDREVLKELAPRAFFFTDHYRDYPAVLIRLPEVPPTLFKDVIRDAWRHVSAHQPAHKSSRRAGTPAATQQLKSFIEKFDPKVQKMIHATRKFLRRRFPTANEIVYDNYNFFVIAYAPTERASDFILSLAAAANGVQIFFVHGASLPDPQEILLGSGKQVRSFRVDSTKILERPEVEALFQAASERSRTPFPEKGRGRLIIRSISAKQRPRRHKN